MSDRNRHTPVKLRELATLLASPFPVDHLVGLGRVRCLEGPAQIPILLHVLRTCDVAVRQQLLDRIESFGRRAVRAALEQMFDSDAPHPASAAHYLALVKDPAYNGLAIEWLARSAEPVRAGLLETLARTADARAWMALDRLRDSLPPEALELLASRPARRAIERAREPKAALVNRPPPSRLFGPGRAALHWVWPSVPELAAWALTAAMSLPLLAGLRGPSSPPEFLALVGFLFCTSRCLAGWPARTAEMKRRA